MHDKLKELSIKMARGTSRNGMAMQLMVVDAFPRIHGGRRMTREEAQIIIGNIPIYGDDCYTIPEYQEAKAKAIEALEADVPETNVGEWIPMYNGKFTGGAYWFSCAKCKRVVPDVQNGDWEYCPRCGKRNILNR